MARRIAYRVNKLDGMVYSEMLNGEGWAIPVLQYDEFGNNGNFTGKLPYRLEKFPPNIVYQLDYDNLIYTRKIPTYIKNLHREFWEMKRLPEEEG